MFRNKNLLVTGGTGSFGNAVLHRFLNTEIKEIRIFSRDEKKQDDMRHLLNNPKVKFYIGDVRASGTPCIIHRLLGIPEEYYQYCFVADEENAEGLKKEILLACSKSQSELNEFGRRAAAFIKEYKNPKTQVKKIFDMITAG